MNFTEAHDLGAYSIQFRPHKDGRCHCLIWAYGAWNHSNGKAARETFAVDSALCDDPASALLAATVKLRERLGVSADTVSASSIAVDLEDLL